MILGTDIMIDNVNVQYTDLNMGLIDWKFAAIRKLVFNLIVN